MTVQDIFEELLQLRRGDSEAEVFLKPDYQRDLNDPWLLTDMDKAVERLKQAQTNKERVIVYGDYDIDGLTASTILLDAGRAWGLDISAHIPNRFEDGYGLNPQSVRVIAEQKADLIITVDCGSLSIDEVALANSFGVDVIITDHHAIGETLPDAVAVINPKRKDSKYPHQNLAGVGVAYKLIQAAMTKLDGLEPGQEKWLLDMVALGTVCDIVPLVGENRALVHWGLIVARQQRRLGLRALCQAAGANLACLQSVDMAYKLGPRLNASGRMESARVSLDLLNSRSEVDAAQLANQLEVYNQERRKEQDRITKTALQRAEHDIEPVLILVDKEWSHGIIGIVASKLMQQLRRPTVLMQDLGDTIKGSARSFGDFHLHEAIEAVRDMLLAGGGHSFAAGCTIKAGDFDTFKQRINDYYRQLHLKGQSELLAPRSDIILDNVDLLTDELLELISGLEPFGEKNPAPMFKLNNMTIHRLSTMGADGKHCRGEFCDTSGTRSSFVHFNGARELMQLDDTQRINCYVRLEKNWFRGAAKLQRQLVSWELAN